jgi:D-3-phosphoglycerate dehydrogenase
MAKWKIIISDSLKENGKAILRAQAQVDDHSLISQEDLHEIVGGYDALIVRSRTKVTEKVIAAGQRLRVIGRAGVGVDNIDLAAAQSHNITVVNSPTASTLAVAEHTLGLMLALVRSIPEADSGMKSGFWAKNQLLGSELWGKTLGILGIGRIGRAVAQLASAFGMDVIAHDPIISDHRIRQLGAQPVKLTELYIRSDILSLHAPLTPETHGIINGQSLGHMKRGVRLICTARGGLIDETALLSALESGQVAGVALDVFAKEPPGLTALVAHSKVIATPHISAQTQEAQARSAANIANEVLAALNGDPLRWKIV